MFCTNSRNKFICQYTRAVKLKHIANYLQCNYVLRKRFFAQHFIISKKLINVSFCFKTTIITKYPCWHHAQLKTPRCKNNTCHIFLCVKMLFYKLFQIKFCTACRTTFLYSKKLWHMWFFHRELIQLCTILLTCVTCKYVLYIPPFLSEEDIGTQLHMYISIQKYICIDMNYNIAVKC